MSKKELTFPSGMKCTVYESKREVVFDVRGCGSIDPLQLAAELISVQNTYPWIVFDKEKAKFIETGAN